MWQGFAAHEVIIGGTTFEQGSKVELDDETSTAQAMIDHLISTGVLTDRDPGGGGSRKRSTSRAERGDDEES